MWLTNQKRNLQHEQDWWNIHTSKNGTLLTTPTRIGLKGKQSELVTKQIGKKSIS